MSKDGVSTVSSDFSVGEGFAFAMFQILYAYPRRLCAASMGGWQCPKCQERWRRLRRGSEYWRHV